MDLGDGQVKFGQNLFDQLYIGFTVSDDQAVAAVGNRDRAGSAQQWIEMLKMIVDVAEFGAETKDFYIFSGA